MAARAGVGTAVTASAASDAFAVAPVSFMFTLTSASTDAFTGPMPLIERLDTLRTWLRDVLERTGDGDRTLAIDSDGDPEAEGSGSGLHESAAAAAASTAVPSASDGVSIPSVSLSER